MHLVEEAVEGCWIGHKARTDSEIGSVYAPPRERSTSGTGLPLEPTETVVDIEGREAVRAFAGAPVGDGLILVLQSWIVMCEKGGIRRVLMNLFGNSLKFTSVGQVSSF